MPQALKPLCLIQFWSWENSPFPIIGPLGNKNWLPSMKMQKLEDCVNEMGLKGCIWSSFGTQGFIWLLELAFPLSFVEVRARRKNGRFRKIR